MYLCGIKDKWFNLGMGIEIWVMRLRIKNYSGLDYVDGYWLVSYFILIFSIENRKLSNLKVKVYGRRE